MKHILHVKNILKRFKTSICILTKKMGFFHHRYVIFEIHGIYRWRVNGLTQNKNGGNVNETADFP